MNFLKKKKQTLNLSDYIKLFFNSFLFLSFCLSSLMSFQAWSEEAVNTDLKVQENSSVFKELKAMTKLYSQVNFLHSKFTQKRTFELLGEVKKTKGELYYSHQKMRIDISGDENTMNLITPGVLWSVTLDKKSKKPIQILKGKPAAHPLLKLLFGNEAVWDDFKILKIVKNDKSQLTVILKPKSAKSMISISKIKFTIDKNRSIAKEITYWDDIENETYMYFTYNRFKDKPDGSKFTFNPPKGISVQNM